MDNLAGQQNSDFLPYKEEITMATLKQNIGTITFLTIISALLYLTIYQYQTIQEYQHITGSQFKIIQELQTKQEDPDSSAPDFDGGDEKSIYELQQESGEYPPFESGKLYIPIDTPDNI